MWAGNFINALHRLAGGTFARQDQGHFRGSVAESTNAIGELWQTVAESTIFDPSMIPDQRRTGPDTPNLRVFGDRSMAGAAERIYEDKGVSGSAVFKPAYHDLLRAARAGDEIIVWRLDRLSRNLVTLITELQMLGSLGVGFRSITEEIETVTPAGRLFFHMVGAFAQFERDVIRERTNAGIQAAWRAGKQLGRPPAISVDQWTPAKTLLAEPHNMSVAAVASLLNVTRQAIYKRLNAEKGADQQVT